MFTEKNPSTEYLELIEYYKKIHKEGILTKKNKKILAEDSYNGLSTLKYVDFLKKVIEKNNFKTLLDYGSGKGNFYFKKTNFGLKVFPPIKNYWKIKTTLYDPGVNSKKIDLKKKFDIVISIDVLEHIPHQDLNWVIEKIFSLSKKFVFLNIACYPSRIILDNGHNAHVSIFEPQWWFKHIFPVAKKYRLKVIATFGYKNKNNINYTSFGIGDKFSNY